MHVHTLLQSVIILLPVLVHIVYYTLTLCSLPIKYAQIKKLAIHETSATKFVPSKVKYNPHTYYDL